MYVCLHVFFGILVVLVDMLRIYIYIYVCVTSYLPSHVHWHIHVSVHVDTVPLRALHKTLRDTTQKDTAWYNHPRPLLANPLKSLDPRSKNLNTKDSIEKYWKKPWTQTCSNPYTCCVFVVQYVNIYIYIAVVIDHHGIEQTDRGRSAIPEKIHMPTVWERLTRLCDFVNA